VAGEAGFAGLNEANESGEDCSCFLDVRVESDEGLLAKKVQSSGGNELCFDLEQRSSRLTQHLTPLAWGETAFSFSDVAHD
jgi:hypothetical protein